MIRTVAAASVVLFFTRPAVPLENGASAEFVRGDANFDGRLDVSDPILTLRNLFLDAGEFPCPDAADSDDSGGIDIGDSIRSLSFLFLGTHGPAPPFPAPGSDSTEDSLLCFTPSSGDDIEPPRPVSPEDVEEAMSSFEEPALAFRINEGAIEVSPDLFEALSSLGPGSSLEGLVDFPGIREFMTEALERAAPPGAPVAIPYSLKAPLPADGCYEIDARKLRGLTRDLGPGATEDELLSLDVEPRVVCGPGRHTVRFTATDADGLASWATAMVDLCDRADVDCDEVVSAPDSTGPGQPVPSEQINCVWIATRRESPPGVSKFVRGTHYDEEGRIASIDRTPSILVGTDPLELIAYSNGAGPSHKLHVDRTLPLCTTPSTNRAILGWGRATLRLNMICFSSGDCRIAVNPPCSARTTVEGSYEATLRAMTESGRPCEDPVNFVEALVQEEAKLQVNGSTIFDKAIAIQTGTSVTKRITLEVSGRIGLNNRGLAADVGTTHGLSHEVWDRTGRRVGVLRAFSSATYGIPVTADLTAAGKSEVIARGTANSIAAAATEAYAVYAIGTSNCPGAGTVFLDVHGGRGEALERVTSAQEDFQRQHTGRAWVPPPPGAGGR